MNESQPSKGKEKELNEVFDGVKRSYKEGIDGEFEIAWLLKAPTKACTKSPISGDVDVSTDQSQVSKKCDTGQVCEGSSSGFTPLSQGCSQSITIMEGGGFATPDFSPTMLSHLKPFVDYDRPFRGEVSEEGSYDPLGLGELRTGHNLWGESNVESKEFISKEEASDGVVSCHDFFTPPHQGRLVEYLDSMEHSVRDKENFSKTSIQDLLPIDVYGAEIHPIGTMGSSEDG